METQNVAAVAAVLGVGPGLGAALARRFARGGYAVALLARRVDALQDVKKAITDAGGKAASIPADAADPSSVSAAFAEVRERLGDPEVLIYNAGAFQLGSVLDVTPEQFESSWRANCMGAFSSVREVAPAMLAKGRGTILLSGATAAVRGSANFSCLAVGKFGLRALGQSLARELHPKGIHVAHVIIDGQIDSARARAMSPGRATHTFLDPDGIAESYWQLHRQPPTTWTQELDLRPAAEKF
jgi:NAD(P)-dependent dehydrogenase (short-subunit alcohol dehydrogenase family)